MRFCVIECISCALLVSKRMLPYLKLWLYLLYIDILGVNSSNDYTVNMTTTKEDKGGEGICPSLPISLWLPPRQPMLYANAPSDSLGRDLCRPHVSLALIPVIGLELCRRDISLLMNLHRGHGGVAMLARCSPMWAGCNLNSWPILNSGYCPCPCSPVVLCYVESVSRYCSSRFLPEVFEELFSQAYTRNRMGGNSLSFRQSGSCIV